jgi:hypothetical protein
MICNFFVEKPFFVYKTNNMVYDFNLAQEDGFLLSLFENNIIHPSSKMSEHLEKSCDM